MIAWNATTTATPLVNGAIDHPTPADQSGRILTLLKYRLLYQLSYTACIETELLDAQALA